VTTTIPERHPGQEGAGPSPRPGAEPKPVSPGRRKLRPYILSVPAVAVVIGILYPFVIGVYYAFLNYSAVNPDPVFIGLENFAFVLSSGEFWHSVQVTLTYAIAATLAETVLGIGIALLLNRSSIVGKIFEKVLILPLMIAPVIAAVVWKLMFNPQFGILNHVLGLGSTFDWLNRERALWSTVLVDLWIYTPFVAILAESDNFPTDAHVAGRVAELLGRDYRPTPRSQVAEALTDDIAVAVLAHVDYRTARRHDVTGRSSRSFGGRPSSSIPTSRSASSLVCAA